VKARFRLSVPPWLPLLSAPALLLLLGLPTLLYPYGRDQAMFAYVGRVWRHGGLPYRDAWDVKLPAIYAVYALVGGAEWGPRLLDLLAAAATVAALQLLGRHSSMEESEERRARRPGTLAGCLAVVYTLGALDYWNLSQAETLIAPLAACAVSAALSRRPFLAGLLAGCAATLKTPAVLFLLPVLLAARADGRQEAEDGRRKTEDGRGLGSGVRGPATRGGSVLSPVFRLPSSVFHSLAGWLVPLLLVILYFGARGGLPYLAELLAAQREYAGGDPRLAGKAPGEVIRLLGLTGYLPLAALSAVSLVPWLRNAGPDRRTRLVVALWWLAGAAQVTVQRRFYLYHWAVLTPAAAWLAADGLARAWAGFRDLRPLRLAARCLCLAGGAGLFWLAVSPRWPEWTGAARVLGGRESVQDYRRGFYGVFQYSAAEGMDTAALLRARTLPGDRVMVLAFEPEVYLYSAREAPTRHASVAPVFGETSIRAERRRRWFRELMADVQRYPPLYLVERDPEERARPPWATDLTRFRSRYYAPEAQRGLFRLYRRR
jgi:hypothetical protein